MRSCEKTSSARSRADWLRNSGLPSSAPSTTKRSWPECVASPALIACSIRASASFGKRRLARQWCYQMLADALDAHYSYQLPDAPPPPKLPPPPLKEPLELLPENEP